MGSSVVAAAADDNNNRHNSNNKYKMNTMLSSRTSGVADGYFLK